MRRPTMTARIPYTLLALFVCSIIPLWGQGPLEERREEAKNILYWETAYCGFAGSLSINYERVLSEHITLRLGAGSGMLMTIDSPTYGSVGGLVMVNYVTSGDHKFEAGAGGSLVEDFELYQHRTHGIKPSPALSVGYRYQPSSGGFFFRAGASWAYHYGFPAQISLGYVF